MDTKNFDDYKKDFSEEGVWVKIQKFAKKAGLKVVYTALLLFNAFKRPDTPAWAKGIIMGALGYFLSPVDALPDLTPILGYTDDMGVLGLGLATVAAYINQDVKEKAKTQLSKWFPNYDENELKTVDEKLKFQK